MIFLCDAVTSFFKLPQPVLQQERHNIILQEIALYNKVTTTGLCKLLKVSLDTIRRDLAELENQDKIVKVHGGAVSKTFHIPFQQPSVYAKNEKRKIAEKAITLLQPGSVVLLGGGTIMLELAKLLPRDFTGTIFTVSPLVALETVENSQANVILLGGKLSTESYICTGAAVTSQLQDIRADICFLGSNGISIKEGVTETDWEVAQVKKLMLQAATKSVIMSISEKIDVVQTMKVCSLPSIDWLITELSPTDKKLARYTKRMKKIL